MPEKDKQEKKTQKPKEEKGKEPKLEPNKDTMPPAYEHVPMIKIPKFKEHLIKELVESYSAGKISKEDLTEKILRYIE